MLLLSPACCCCCCRRCRRRTPPRLKPRLRWAGRRCSRPSGGAGDRRAENDQTSSSCPARKGGEGRKEKNQGFFFFHWSVFLFAGREPPPTKKTGVEHFFGQFPTETGGVGGGDKRRQTLLESCLFGREKGGTNLFDSFLLTDGFTFCEVCSPREQP